MLLYCAYLFSCHRTASDAKYWTIRTLIITMTTSWLEESAPASEFPVIQSSDEFLRILAKFAASSKPPSRDNHCETSDTKVQQRGQGVD